MPVLSSAVPHSPLVEGASLSIQFARARSKGMAKEKVVGICRLCGKRKALCKSHYLGRALHKLCRENGESAIMMTPKVIMATQRQLWAHLLCGGCEQRLNKFGETPVLRWLDNGKTFPLLERMRLSCALKEERGVVTFSGTAMGVDTEPLAYFSLGLLWKGAVYQWKTVEGQTTTVNVGPYEESIRKYLLGDTGFPEGVFVLLAVCEDKGSRGMIFAPTLVAGTAHQMFSILIRGLWFHIIVDKNAAAGNKNLCCVQSEKKVLHLEDCSERFLHAGRHIHKTAKVAVNVKR